MHRHAKLAIFLMIFSLIAVSSAAWAGGIKERMAKRLPVIVDLKARGVVGENNQGYLEYLKGAKEKNAAVKAENADRRAIYTAIAKKQGTSPDHVGKRRAMQIAEKAKPGEWLQNKKGQWQKK